MNEPSGETKDRIEAMTRQLEEVRALNRRLEFYNLELQQQLHELQSKFSYRLVKKADEHARYVLRRIKKTLLRTAFLFKNRRRLWRNTAMNRPA